MKFSTAVVLATIMGFLCSCRKKEIVPVPVPCVSVNSSSVHLADTLFIRNCSKADKAFIYVKDSVQCSQTSFYTYSGPVHYFNAKNLIKYTFSKTGLYHVYLLASYNVTNSPMKFDSAIVRVNP